MTSVLDLVPIRREDDSPAAAWAVAGQSAVYYMTAERARALTDTTRAMLGQAGANLVDLRAGSAHLALGYDEWWSYVVAEFGDLGVYKLVKDRHERVAERRALVASLTLSGFPIREQHAQLGASLGTIHADQRALGLVPDKPSPVVEPEPVDPFRGLSPRWAALARVAAQGDRGLTSLELDDELDAALGTATGSLSKLAARRFVATVDGLDTLRRNRRPYVVTAAGRARLVEVLAARDAAELA